MNSGLVRCDKSHSRFPLIINCIASVWTMRNSFDRADPRNALYERHCSILRHWQMPACLLYKRLTDSIIRKLFAKHRDYIESPFENFFCTYYYKRLIRMVKISISGMKFEKIKKVKLTLIDIYGSRKSKLNLNFFQLR